MSGPTPEQEYEAQLAWEASLVWTPCTAIVWSEPGRDLYFIGRAGEPLIHEDEPGSLFAWLKVEPPSKGLWLWVGESRIVGGSPEYPHDADLRLRGDFRRLTPDEAIALACENRKPWEPVP